jgi:hypothetical protein
MFKDVVRQEVFDQLREHDLRVFAKHLTYAVFVEAARRAGLRLWSCPLNLANLVWLAMAAAWRKSQSFVSILTVTLKLLQDQEQFSKTRFGRDLAKKRRCQRRGNKAKKFKKKRPANIGRTVATSQALPKRRLPRHAGVCRCLSGCS